MGRERVGNSTPTVIAAGAQPATLHGASAADLLEWSEWVVEHPTDPAAVDARD